MSTTELTSGLGVRRPQRSDAARNFDALVAAGRDAFSEHGSDATLEDIARRAGVGIATLYRNFPTRDDLVETLYVQEVEALAAAADDTAGLEAGAALEQWLQRFVQYVGTKRALVEALNGASEVFAQCRLVIYGAGEPLLQRAQDSGAIRADVSISDVVRLISGVAGVAGYDDDEQRRRVIGLAIGGLRA